MKMYIEGDAWLHKLFLRFFTPEDIYTYSIDETFIDVTLYLRMYNVTPKDLSKTLIQKIQDDVGTISIYGIDSNMYLPKVRPGLHRPAGQKRFRKKLWDHKPLIDTTLELLALRGMSAARRRASVALANELIR